MEKLIDSCVAAMMELKVINEQKRDIMVYGLDLLFSSIISLLSFAVLGFLIGKGMQTFWLLVIYIPLQSFGGGYHCQTHLRCWLMMMAGYILAVFGVMRLPLVVLWGGAVIAGFVFFKWAPIENEKAPFGVLFRKKMRKAVVLVYLGALMIAAVAVKGNAECVKAVLTAVGLAGFSIVCAEVKKRVK